MQETWADAGAFSLFWRIILTVLCIGFAVGIVLLLYRALRLALRFLQRRLSLKLAISYFFTAFIPVFLLGLISFLALYVFTGSYRSGLAKQVLYDDARQLSNLARYIADNALELKELPVISLDTARGSRIEYVVVLEPSGGNEIRKFLHISSHIPTIHSTTGYVTPLWVPSKGAYGIYSVDGVAYLRAIGVAEGGRGVIYADLFQKIDQDYFSNLKELLGMDITFRMEEVVADGQSVSCDPRRVVITTRSKKSSSGFLDREFKIGVAPLELFEWTRGGLSRTKAFIDIYLTPSGMTGTTFSSSNRMNFILYSILRLLLILVLLMILIAVVAGFLIARRITGSVAALRRGTQMIRQGDLDWEIAKRSNDELGELALSFNEMRRDIKRMLRELGEKERMERELQIARTIQENLLPGKLPDIHDMKIWANSYFAREVGGDYYDCFMGPEGKLHLVVGDVSGKGISAALLMSNLQASLHTILAVSTSTIEEIIQRLNSSIYENSGSETFVTLFYAEIDINSGVMEFVNAGHNYPYLIRGEDILELKEGGLVVGVFPESTYEVARSRLHPGDVLMCYTDGVTEARDLSGREFGDARLRGFLCERRTLGPREIGESLLDTIMNYSRDGIQEDDITILIVQIGQNAFNRSAVVSSEGAEDDG
jgi:serine phosphatase RsbU (regulator of sigma subunit)